MDAIARWILANPAEALALLSSVVALIVAALTRIPWLKVPEAKLRRWLTTVLVAIVTGLATEWLSPPFEWGKAFAWVLAALGGATAIYRAVKWVISQLKPKE